MALDPPLRPARVSPHGEDPSAVVALVLHELRRAGRSGEVDPALVEALGTGTDAERLARIESILRSLIV